MKRAILALGLLLLAAAAPAAAGDFAFFGSYWDTELLGETAGGGAKVGFGGTLQLELRGSYFPDVTADVGDVLDTDDDSPLDFELEAVPVEAGLAFQFGSGAVRPYIGGGVSYFLLDSNLGEVDDHAGYYAVAGLKTGAAGVGFLFEAMYRSVESSVAFDPDELGDIDDIDFDDDVKVDLTGFAANVGVVFSF